jgi:hypothetical protein
VAGLLEAIVDPAAAALCNAPVDDEPESDTKGVKSTRQASAYGRTAA